MDGQAFDRKIEKDGQMFLMVVMAVYFYLCYLWQFDYLILGLK